MGQVLFSVCLSVHTSTGGGGEGRWCTPGSREVSSPNWGRGVTPIWLMGMGDTPSSPDRGVYPHLADRGYPIWPMGGYPGVPSPHRDWIWYPPVRTGRGYTPPPVKNWIGSLPPVGRSGDRAATRRTVYLLRSRRRTFLSFMFPTSQRECFIRFSKNPFVSGITSATLKACLHTLSLCPSPSNVFLCAHEDGHYDGQNGYCTHCTTLTKTETVCVNTP